MTGRSPTAFANRFSVINLRNPKRKRSGWLLYPHGQLGLLQYQKLAYTRACHVEIGDPVIDPSSVSSKHHVQSPQFYSTCSEYLF